MRRNADSGSDAISPHTLAGFPAARPASATILSNRITLGSCGVKRSASRALPRSTTRVYCVRSFVPTLRKSLIAASWSAITAAAGVSTITPTGSVRAAWAPLCASRSASSATMARVRSTSAAHADIRLMIPLVTRLDEVERTRAIVAEEAERLAQSGAQAARTLPVGVMVETPAAAVMADRLAAISDFLSVGTNDLTQYTLVVDRGNARLADRFTPHDPSVIRLLKIVADAGRAAGKPASVCGEMASEPLSAFLLIGLGYETLSVAPPALPLVKWTVRQISAAQARAAAESALAARTADEVLDILRLALDDAVDLKLLDPDARLPAGRRAASLNV